LVNEVRHEIDTDPQTPLLYVLRNGLGLKGTRFGCGSGQLAREGGDSDERQRITGRL
jgi:aerobic-type carbon monoxide dehydrogenase small subunit (CoxS/CutS family)